MRGIRPTAAAILILIVATATAGADCVSAVPVLRAADATPMLRPGPVAWSGTVLGVASDEGASKAIWFAAYSEHGVELVPPVSVATSSQRGPVALLWSGLEFGLFYVRDQTLMLQRISSDGTLLGAATPILPGTFVAASDQLAFAWSAALDAYVVARSATSGLRPNTAYVIERSGAIRRTVDLHVGASSRANLRVAVTESGVIGVFYTWAAGDRIVYARINERADAFINDVWTAGDDLVAASHDNRFVLARTFELSGGKEIRWIAVDTSGQVVRPESVLVRAPGVDIAPVALVGRGPELALAYLESSRGFTIEPASYRLLRFTPSGELISDTLFAAAEPVRHRSISTHPFAWTGSAYVNAVARPAQPLVATHLARLCPLTVRIIAPRSTTLGSSIDFSAIVGGGVPGYTYRWALGDRNFSVQPSPKHTYGRLGEFRVTLSVTDAAGATTSDEFLVTVVEPQEEPPPPAKPARRRGVRK